MKNYLQFILLAGLGIWVWRVNEFAHPGTKPVNTDSTRGFAVIELFTSEGCSSCPAADALAAAITTEKITGVYYLAFHVDYWNQYGWKDVFSSNNYTARQEQYAGFFNLKSIYTPQVVVNGKSEFVGSNESKLRTAIQEGLQSPATVSINLQAIAEARTVAVTCSVSGAPNSVVNIALVQAESTIAVNKGENAGRTLKHVDIVRSFKKLAVLKDITNKTVLYIPEGLSAKDLKVIAYVQNRDDYKVTGVAVKKLQ